MRNTCRAGCDRKNVREAVRARSRSSRFLFLFLHFLGFRAVNHGQEILRCLRGAKILHKLFIHQHRSQTRKHVKMNIFFCIGCRDHEEQVRRFAVRCVIIDAAFNGHGGKSRTFYGIRLGMRDSDTFAHGRGALFFTGKDGLLIFCDV